jgi:hypothetical protein
MVDPCRSESYGNGPVGSRLTTIAAAANAIILAASRIDSFLIRPE